MLRETRAFAALAFVLALLLSSCNCSNNKCGPTNCPGCCDESGTCQGGFLADHCGAAGAACTSCAVGQMCTAGHCGLVSTGGGSGTGGGFGTGGGTGTGGGFSVGGGGGSNQFCQSYASAYCDYAIRCGLADNGARTDCVSYLTSFYCSALESVTKGYQTLNTTNANACIAFIQNASCDLNTSSSSSPCDDVSSPASGDGQGCFESTDCTTPGDGCGGTNACALSCQPAGPLGAPCPCNDGLRCDYATQTCANPHNVGEACQELSSNECVAGAMCDSTSKTCVSLPGSGPCYLGEYCAPSAYCDGNTTCQPRVGQDQTCTFENCAQNLWCNYAATGGPKCQPVVGPGGSCSSGDACQSGLTCKNGQCTAPGGSGAPCQYYSDCASTLDCDQVLRTCQTYDGEVPQGGACTDSALSCAYPLTCHGALVNPDGGVGSEGVCNPAMLGDPCDSQYSGCPSQAYCKFADAGVGTCTAANHGTPCGQNTSCLSGDYCNGGSCVALATSGQPCNGSGSCTAPLQCVTQSADAGSSGLCGSLGGLNATCAGTNSCMFPYSCVSGHCASSGHANEPCLNDFLCFNGACQQDAGLPGYGLCTGTKRPDGAACFYPTDCQSGLCRGFSTCASTCP